MMVGGHTSSSAPVSSSELSSSSFSSMLMSCGAASIALPLPLLAIAVSAGWVFPSVMVVVIPFESDILI